MNTETMMQVYLLAQEHCGLEVGDFVQVTRCADSYEAGWPCHWTIYHTEHIGDIGKIISILQCGCGIRFEKGSSGLLFPYFILKKVEKPAHKFKPFDKVLVRDYEHCQWTINFFVNYIADVPFPYKVIAGGYYQCIPYEGNEHLVGTTDKPDDSNEEKMNGNRPQNLHEVNGCHNCKYSVYPYWREKMSCYLYDYKGNSIYDICDSWEEDK